MRTTEKAAPIPIVNIIINPLKILFPIYPKVEPSKSDTFEPAGTESPSINVSNTLSKFASGISDNLLTRKDLTY